jgi:uncharacterized membrane protein HdeD (DUF308 family)
MLRILIDNWWLLACRAAFAWLFAIYVWFIQGAKLPLLLRVFAHASTVVLFGFLAFGAGIFTLAAALRPSSRGHDRRLLLIDGVGVCFAGVIVAVVPTLTLTSLARIIAFWAFFVAICEVLMARTIRRHLPDEWFLAVAGAGSLVFGAVLLQNRAFSDSFLLAWLGSYALFSALTMSGLAFRLWRARTIPLIARRAAT